MAESGRGPKPFDAKKINEIGETLSLLGEEAKDFARQLESAEFAGELKIDAGKNIDLAIDALQKWLPKLRGALIKELSPYKVPEDPPEQQPNGRRKRQK